MYCIAGMALVKLGSILLSALRSAFEPSTVPQLAAVGSTIDVDNAGMQTDCGGRGGDGGYKRPTSASDNSDSDGLDANILGIILGLAALAAAAAHVHASVCSSVRHLPVRSHNKLAHAPQKSMWLPQVRHSQLVSKHSVPKPERPLVRATRQQCRTTCGLECVHCTFRVHWAD